jgi:hypothetical protein
VRAGVGITTMPSSTICGDAASAAPETAAATGITVPEVCCSVRSPPDMGDTLRVHM